MVFAMRPRAVDKNKPMTFLAEIFVLGTFLGDETKITKKPRFHFQSFIPNFFLPATLALQLLINNAADDNETFRWLRRSSCVSLHTFFSPLN